MTNTTPLNIGILAHVDAGKTTLSEALLYASGTLKKIGRVDHKDAFLDTYDLEKSRGITIFSKQARLTAFERNITLLDTPGHVDFSPEMERTLQVLDAAILVISSQDSSNAHVKTLWSLLNHYNVPTFIFVNKMDQAGANKDIILKKLTSSLSSHIVDFTLEMESEEFQEAIAVCDDNLMEQYLENASINDSNISDLIDDRKLFPCFFGSALKLEGIDFFLEKICKFCKIKHYPDEFGAKVYKIARDDDNTRLTYCKITGSGLKVRDMIKTVNPKTNEVLEEKIAQIRLYSGNSFKLVTSVPAGTVCAITGLSTTKAGEGLGYEQESTQELLEPILNCRIILTDDEDPYKVYMQLLELQEEEPMLHVYRIEQTCDIYVRVMGKVQMEILKHLMLTRFNTDIDFGEGRIIYKETIESTVEGVGHFEPLRHYAEVHLLLTPTGIGSGLTFDCNCSTDILAKNWQRLILTHLQEKKHVGVLTGSEITDMKITLTSGRAHNKHTEGGDFRQATYRAVRQGLMMAKSILLEPVYRYELNILQEHVGRAMTDLQQKNATIEPPIIENGKAILKGTIPVACLGNYAEEVRSYTKGEGSISCFLKDYEPCHNAEEVIESFAYDPEADLNNPPGSVFCSHGVGTVIPWNEVRHYMHVESEFLFDEEKNSSNDLDYNEEFMKSFNRKDLEKGDNRSFSEKQRDILASEKELHDIFERTYGKIPERNYNKDKDRNYNFDYIEKEKGISDSKYDEKILAKQKKNASLKKFLLVDGYNVLFASPYLNELAQKDLKGARDKLCDILSNHQGTCSEHIILVFDAYKVEGGKESISRYHNIDIVYTKEAETADQYIEKTSHILQKNYTVRVATSDSVEQLIIYGAGAVRLSARDFWNEIENSKVSLRNDHLEKPSTKLHNYVLGPDFKE